MNTPHDNPGTGPRDDAALTPEERELAEQIARAAPQRGPSPALDASILRAARVAVAAPHPSAPPATAATRSTSTRRRAQRRRWPAVFGVAATLALAFGLAWQLRPVDEVRVMTSEAPSIPPRPQTGSGGPSAEDQSALVIQERAAAAPAQAADAVSAPEAPADTAQAKAIRQNAPRAQDEAEVKQVFAMEPVPDAAQTVPISPAPAMAPPPPPPQEPPVLLTPPPTPAERVPTAPVAAESAPQAAPDQFYRAKERRAPAPAPGAMSAPAPVSAPAPATVPTVSGNAASGVVAPSPELQKRESQKQESEKGTELDRIEVTGSHIQGFEDQPIDDEPPASADSPEVREAWLKRVRELVTQGDRDAARDSLREYRRRYPDAAIPDDLRPLLSE